MSKKRGKKITFHQLIKSTSPSQQEHFGKSFHLMSVSAVEWKIIGWCSSVPSGLLFSPQVEAIMESPPSGPQKIHSLLHWPKASWCLINTHGITIYIEYFRAFKEVFYGIFWTIFPKHCPATRCGWWLYRSVKLFDVFSLFSFKSKCSELMSWTWLSAVISFTFKFPFLPGTHTHTHIQTFP